MIWGFTEIEGWFYVKKFNYYQKTNGRAVAYVIKRAFSGYTVQVYKRGRMHYCDIEKRFSEHSEAFEYALEMLNKYESGNQEEMHQDYYSPWNLDGYWETEYYRERV